MCYEGSFFQHCVKNGPKRLQQCSFSTKTFLLIGRLVFTSFSSTTTLKLFLTLRTHLTSHQAIFGCFQHWRTPFVVAYFQVIPLLQQRFSSGHNEPLKNRLLWPCNRGISIVKNVYVYRVITLRNDCIFSFLLPRMNNFFLNKLGDLRTWMHYVFMFGLFNDALSSSSSSSSIGITAHCGLWPVEQCPSIFTYLPPTLSIFSLPN